MLICHSWLAQYLPQAAFKEKPPVCKLDGQQVRGDSQETLLDSASGSFSGTICSPKQSAMCGDASSHLRPFQCTASLPLTSLQLFCSGEINMEMTVPGSVLKRTKLKIFLC